MVPRKFELECLCTGSSTNENFFILTGTNEVQRIGIFEILACRGGGASEMVPQKNFKYLFTGNSTNKDLSIVVGTNEVQTTGIFEDLICVGRGASEMFPQKEF